MEPRRPPHRVPARRRGEPVSVRAGSPGGGPGCGRRLPDAHRRARPARPRSDLVSGLTVAVVRRVDDRAQHVARVPAAGGAIERLITGRRVIASFSPGPDAALAVLASTATEIPEIHALENGALRRLTTHNDAWFAGVQVGTTEDFTSISKDGTQVHSLLVTPSGHRKGQKLPLLLRIHGGPNGQDQHSWNFERELYAAHGYAVLAVNYRGSNGRGSAFQKAIYGDWGNLEVVDLLGAVDEAIKMGVADPERLGIGGWSYGSILTNYTIATDTRFKAATSGAGSSNQITMYGTDQYITQYEMEIGPPWKAQDRWIRISYPFFHADRIRTPTLFMGGRRTSTCRSPAASRCTRRCAAWVSTRSSSSIRASSTA
jgi:dipeptidyl aminopeptidase/acylaminoacyl peptidase